MATWAWILTIVLVLTACGALLVAAAAWRRRHVPGAPFLAYMMLGAAVWCGGHVGELAADTLGGKLFWVRVTYFGVATVGPNWLLFCLRYTGRIPAPSLVMLAVFYTVPAVTVVLAFLSPVVPAVLAEVRLAPGPTYLPLRLVHGPWFWVNLAYGYFCLLGGVIFLVSVFRLMRPFTAQSLTIIAAVLLPWLANLVTVLGLTPIANLDLTPSAIVLAVALIGVSLRRMHALEIFPALVPAARDTALESMRDGVLVIDTRCHILEANPAAGRLLERDRRELVGHPLADALSDEADRIAACDGHHDDWRCGSEVTLRLPHQSERTIEVRSSPLRMRTKVTGHVLVLRDVTEQRRAEAELRHRATHDDLTGLPNRALLTDTIDRLLAGQRRESDAVVGTDAHQSTGLALLLMDLDRFREINDTFGHTVGDTLLEEVAKVLTEAVDEGAFVARPAGDEFCVVLPATDLEHAMETAARLRRALLSCVALPGQRVSVGGSVGVALSPLHGSDAATLLRHADIAARAAKDGPRGVALYNRGLDPSNPQRLELLHDLREAIDRGGLTLAFQPEVDVRTGALVRLEALARWARPDGTQISPAEFIPLAEQNGLMPAISSWAVHAALRQRREWQDRGWEVDVAVNLSALDLRDPELGVRIRRSLAEHGLPGNCLWIEITETAVMRDPDKARAALVDVCETGARASLDDFGVGNCSLTYVDRLPADDIKIDQSFVQGLGKRPHCAPIVKAVVSLAHDLGRTVTCEGVEDRATLELVRSLGADHAQGYYFARPLDPESAFRWRWDGGTSVPQGPLPITETCPGKQSST